MIRPGLQRIHGVLARMGHPERSFQAVHVAGTNGKGLVVATVALVLRTGGRRVGVFTSPHLVTPRESVGVDGGMVGVAEYESVLRQVAAVALDLSPFETLTATAFEVFRRHGVEYAVVEVGMGGRLDATNVVHPVATAVTHVGIDHIGFLGESLEEIAGHKAGICKPGVPCVVDGSNDAVVVEVVRREGSPVVVAAPNSTTRWGNVSEFTTPLLGGYQRNNLAVALCTLDAMAPQEITREVVERGLAAVRWPGRLDRRVVEVDGVEVGCLLDGAHNVQAAVELDRFLGPGKRLFVVAFTKGKDVRGVMEVLVRPGDSVVATRFGEVEGMPWVEAERAETVAEVAREFTGDVAVESAIDKAVVQAGKHGEVVVCGSLYLVGTVLSGGVATSL